MNEIYIYLDYSSWLNETPDTTLKGDVMEVDNGYVKIRDTQGYIQILSLSKIFAVVY